tara:strand:+ start:7607 stop:9010 length:1404 start_codon:yes stop_codon:yes gene_type:complete
MTVIRPNSISGVSSITGQGGDISIFRADGTAADVFVNNITSGVITATTFKGAVEGSGANLTNLPAANITGTLPAIDGSNLTGVGVGTDGSLNTSGIITATAFVPTTQGSLSHRNIIINGGMTIAQRAASSTSGGYNTVDRWQVNHSVQAAPTSAQVAVASGTSPYTLGFRKALKITNGNQSNGAQANTIFYIRQFIESQDVATSGWNYTDPNSKITLSFWIKSSIAQSFHGHVRTEDGTPQLFPFQTGSLSQDTWTKIIKVIPGNSNLQFDDNNERGLAVVVAPYMGTTYSGSSAIFDQWQTNSSGIFAGTDMTTTWYTTNASTLEFTGFQLEVGPVATPFEHRTFNENLLLCQRYFCKSYNYNVYSTSTDSADHFDGAVCQRSIASTGSNLIFSPYPVLMRTEPTVTLRGPTAATDASGTIRGSGNTAISVGGFQNTNSPRQLAFYFTSNQSNSFISGHYYADAEL